MKNYEKSLAALYV